jgi:hypothetical protein
MATLHTLARRWLPEAARDALVRGMTLAGVQLRRLPGAAGIPLTDVEAARRRVEHALTLPDLARGCPEHG